jgi:hypothetical protein
MGTAYFYAPGNTDIYVRIPKRGAGPYYGPANLLADPTPPTFLGHCEKAPEPAFSQKWKPVYSAQTGPAVPTDRIYLGTDVKVVLTLQRWDYDVLHALMAAPRYGRVTPPGTETYLDIGVMKQRNGVSFELWLRNAFYGTINAAAYPDLPIGTYYLCCNLSDGALRNFARDTAMVQMIVEPDWVQQWPAGERVCWTHNPDYFKILPTVG